MFGHKSGFCGVTSIERAVRCLGAAGDVIGEKIIANRRWPTCWRQHLVHLIHKRKSTAVANNYRGVHLTSQLPKVVERAIASLTFLTFRPGRGSFWRTPICIWQRMWIQKCSLRQHLHFVIADGGTLRSGPLLLRCIRCFRPRVETEDVEENASHYASSRHCRVS